MVIVARGVVGDIEDARDAIGGVMLLGGGWEAAGKATRTPAMVHPVVATAIISVDQTRLLMS